MSTSLAGQVDYFLLIGGLAWMLAAAASWGLSRLHAAGEWKWFAFFGLVQGLAEWTDLLQFAMRARSDLVLARLMLHVAAALFLLEFAVGRLWPSQRRVEPRHIAVFVLLGLAFLGGRAGLPGFLVTLRPLLMLPAGLLAAAALWRPGRSGGAASGRLAVASCGLADYFLLLGLVVPSVPLWYASWLTTEPLFFSVLGVPPAFLRALGAVLVGAALLRHLYQVRLAARPEAVARRLRRRWAWPALAVLGVLAGGWLATGFAGRSRAAAMRHEILLRTQIAAAAVPREPVRNLQWGEADLASAEYQSLKSLMMSLRGANPDLRFASLMGLRDGESYVLVDSEPPDSPDYSPPGQHYAEADPEYNRLLARAEDFVMGPLYDRWGVWMTGAAPVTRLESGAVVSLALDIDAGNWDSLVSHARLPMMAITLLIAGLVLVFFTVQRRTREAALVKAALADRIRAQQDAVVKLALSPVPAAGDVAAAARELTERASAALSVERVSLWIGNPERGFIRCQDLFERSTGRHTGGEIVQAADCPSYFEALAAGRAIDAVDAPRDPRTAELLDDYLTPLGITSLLDAPVRVSGRVEGVVSFEQVGPPRVWQEDEIRFAGEIADQAAQALLASERRRAAEEKRALEERMGQAQKLESLGILAGGLAHDFNNLLMPIMGNADMMIEELPPDSPHRESLREIVQLAGTAAELCRQMLSYAGRGHLVTGPLNLSQLVRQMNAMLEVAVAKRAILAYRLADGLPPARGDAAQFRQIVMNLALNAAEALEKGPGGEGRIEIATGVMEADAAYLRACAPGTAASVGPHVFLEVSDNGEGMTPQVMEKLFDPFFSTRFVGRGLGLSAVLGIVHSHGGAIHVRSRPGFGSTFRVLLPPAAAESAVQAGPEASTWHGHGTLLLVDDEPAVRRVVQGMLEKLGFQVLTASDGRQAIEVFSRQGESVAGVLLDLTMPGMKGNEVLEALRRIRPDVRVIVSSGFDEQDVFTRLTDIRDVGFIQKPYAHARLVEVLRRLWPPDTPPREPGP